MARLFLFFYYWFDVDKQNKNYRESGIHRTHFQGGKTFHVRHSVGGAPALTPTSPNTLSRFWSRARQSRALALGWNTALGASDLRMSRTAGPLKPGLRGPELRSEQAIIRSSRALLLPAMAPGCSVYHLGHSWCQHGPLQKYFLIKFLLWCLSRHHLQDLVKLTALMTLGSRCSCATNIIYNYMKTMSPDNEAFMNL